MKETYIILAAVFVPVLGSFLLPLIGRFSTRIRNVASFLFVLTSFLCSLALVSSAMAGKAVVFSRQLPLGFNLSFTADGLAVFMACVSSSISAIIILYSFGYISHYENQNEYYFMVVLFLGAMMGLVFSSNLIPLYIFWEITAITSWRLIGFFREKTHVFRADKAFLVTVFGALAMLIGFISIYQQAGSFELSVIKEAFRTNPLPGMVVLLILIGILSKSATLPFHTWLPDAGVAPSPVTALLHAAVLVKIGVYVFARLFVATFALPELWHTVIPVIAGASALVSAAAALIETDIKRIIAYSTVSQIGFIFFGLAVGNEIGVIGAMLYILTHGLAKAGLFLSAGIIEQNTKTKDITKLGGLMGTMPVTAISFLFCAFSVMGVPPLGGFFSKYLVFSGAVNRGDLWIAGVFLLGAFLTIIYLFRLFNLVFLGKSAFPQAREGSLGMVSCVAALAVLSVLSGIFISYPAKVAGVSVQQMLGMIK